ncbi:hypothetical protein [Mesorhizobium sp.]|uniref:hypothetical protein n=1 Tax=Mesorhizobium sp. TaxID=1871066 RepID=UPI000FE42DDC|nr:hypothetical protein [Mesorhizobium sp.]RWG76076.1 MAG: hypothetical protein EOQ69_32625 [Mesorhizobium sp.]RWG76743.1 MAG: hypothetical protein EOQ70_33120 [Mesorhizobium sp.]RWJ94132.1 MAG: hypothetical protein EOR42_31605 [Mesorhizobium sp.]RWJ98923.1 MAG: hypothetical protein EOR39_32605 [Mesorhizobium sp.]RWK12432.1 MAG: hypothetical protein EOR41_33135 [Mesorhizobium sp.]
MTVSGFDQRFNGPFLKVRSAKRHINNIYTAQQTYFGRGPFEVFDEVHNGLQIFKARSTEPRSGKIALENVRLQTYIGFGQVGAVAGEPIIPVLNAMADMCQEIIETIAAAMVPK